MMNVVQSQGYYLDLLWRRPYLSISTLITGFGTLTLTPKATTTDNGMGFNLTSIVITVDS